MGTVKDTDYEFTGGTLFIFQESLYKNFNYILGIYSQLQMGIIKDTDYKLIRGTLFIFQESPCKNFNCVLSTYD